MPSARIPKGYGRYHKQYREISEGQTPSLADLGNLSPAPWLPVYKEDDVHDDPIVIPAGTWVGRLNTVDHNDAADVVDGSTGANQYLVPACASTGEYTLTYTALDLAEVGGRTGTPDIDNYPTVVASAGVSTITIPPVKPIGVAMYDMYGTHLRTQYKNYNRQHMVTFRSWGYTIEVPVMTVPEALIQPGDIVQIDDNGGTSASYAPTSADNVVGRLKAWASGDSPEFKVGRCLEKTLIAAQSSISEGQTYEAGNNAGNATSIHDFRGLKHVQTPPGLGLQGSGTGGVPGYLAGARARGGLWYSLKIQVGCQ